MTIRRKFVLSFLCLLCCCVSAQSQPDEDIKILINSHAHYDHAGGLALLKEL